ncbi:hypothetical protein QQS21_010872 [Conoideocrella luteorostrata]|uniref:Uncharacterized protein n=1 Tax=Conoideocrella luteorostrata TaxID=1105319 RepID=A0AAJ0FP16_9HYPO|nr:hypothetical protein QQS21_010872 [Conoideocrella luteorostrata]
MAELLCAATIASLEGRAKLRFQASDDPKPTCLPSLDRRVRLLEDSARITCPPPMENVSWNGLNWRIWRLRAKQHITMMPVTCIKQDPSIFQAMIPDTSEISLDTIKHVFGSYNVTDLPLGSMTWVETDADQDDETNLSLAVQALCYIAGWRGLSFEVIPTNLTDVYVAAVRLSLISETTPLARLPAALPPPGYAGRGYGKKMCCGCCGCQCHSKPAPVDILNVRPARRRRASFSSGRSLPARERTFGRAWLRKLCFWRKKPIMDDSSSTSSLTIV